MLRNSKQLHELWAFFNLLDAVAEGGRFNRAGLTPIESVLAANVWEVFIWAGHDHHIKSLTNS